MQRIFFLAIIMATFFGASTRLSAQCDTTGTKLAVTLQPSSTPAGRSIQFVTAPTVTIPTTTLVRFTAFVDGIRVKILGVTSRTVDVLLPGDLVPGTHTAWFCIDDGPFASAQLLVTEVRDDLDTAMDKTDPDPRTNRGPREDLSTVSRRPRLEERRTYPNGGFGGTLPCHERHKIDGSFTVLPDRTREWAGIPPMIGRYSHMYLDYCSDKNLMYLMNDWYIGTGTYKPNCYNLFDFTTGNGAERWRIKVTHDSTRPVIVLLNGEDVTDDTNLVFGGGFGYGPSPSDTTPHTIYEFAVRVSGGLFMIPYGSDPVQYLPSTGIGLDCDESITPEYGLIQEPMVRSAMFTESGISIQQYERYIPPGGVVGLEVEPNVIAGTMGGDTIRYRSGNGPMVTNTCTNSGVIDGIYTAEEWAGHRPANGVYSDLYATYCNGHLHILNDWVLATAMPNNATCYNLFELYTGNGSEHWGIWVFQDPARKPRVFRNSVEVTDDTTIVKAGKAGWAGSPRLEEPHAQYEFEIIAAEGAFALQYADPGPASFCSLETSVDESVTASALATHPQPYRPADGPLTIRGLRGTYSVEVIDLRGRVMHTVSVTGNGAISLSLPTTLAPGRYTVRCNDGSSIHNVPVMIAP